MPSISKLGRRRIRKQTAPAVRKSVQLSNAIMGELDDRAAQETLPLAAVVRRAVTQFLETVDSTGALPDVNVARLDEAIRTGRRGPATQWPERVSYVLPRDLADRLEEAAQRHQVTTADFVRRALHASMAEPSASIRPLRRTEAGFVTAAPPRGAAARGRQTVDLFEGLGNKE